MSAAKPGDPMTSGMIAWMTRNRVTPNLIMVVCLVGGFFFARTIKKEVFPEFEMDTVSVSVPYPGSSPEEVEQGIILAVEESIRGLDGVKELRATAGEGFGTVLAELQEGADTLRVYQDIKQAVDRIVTFPQDAERPEVSMLISRREVLQIQLYGDTSEGVLRELAEQVRDSLLAYPEITQVELRGVREYQIHVQIDQETLRRYDLTLAQVANRIRMSAIEIPGGTVETLGGDILLRVKERRDWAHEYADLPIISSPEGAIVRLSDIAQVTDDFQEADREAYYDGQRAIGLAVYRVGRETPIGISDATRAAMAQIEGQLPPGISWTINRDRAGIYRQRLHLLLRNACLGLILVLGLLGLFLEFKLAFWVTMGIPTAFLGAFLFLPHLGVTINMISMFAFIVALGIVVDDAIVVGENIYEAREQGSNMVDAAILGARNVALPVTFSILSNMVAFLPLMFIPGVMGKIWKVIPITVITVFAISWVEALLILPAHLSHAQADPHHWVGRKLHGMQQAFSRGFIQFVHRFFAPFLDFCMRFRYVTVAASIAVFIVVLSFVANGRIGVIMMPRVEADVAVVTAVLPFGSPAHKVQALADILVARAEEMVAENGQEELSEGVFTRIEENRVETYIYLTRPEIRPLTTGEVTRRWREKVGQMPGLESLRFEADRGGPGSGAALSIELSHRDITALDQASARLAEVLAGYPIVTDIDDGYTPGKQQLNFRIKPEGQILGLTAQDIARQVRNAFFGAQAIRQQRGRNEVRLYVKLPKEQRSSEYDIEQLLIRTAAGTDVPLMHVAEVDRGRAYTSIERRNGRRTVTVTANVVPIEQTSQVKATLEEAALPQLVADFPGLSFRWAGRQQSMGESMDSMFSGFILAMMAIYVMLAIPFRSYAQPLIVMAAIPFGMVGAVLGHMIMGYALSLMSFMGIVALSGVVINDSLILIDYANRLRREGVASTAFDAIHRAGVRRFRPIILTTLTTFGGLAPMIFETSRQARFLIPMALSLGYGIVFATAITLLLVPCLYMALDDLERLWHKTSALV